MYTWENRTIREWDDIDENACSPMWFVFPLILFQWTLHVQWLILALDLFDPILVSKSFYKLGQTELVWNLGGSHFFVKRRPIQ